MQLSGCVHSGTGSTALPGQVEYEDTGQQGNRHCSAHLLNFCATHRPPLAPSTWFKLCMHGTLRHGLGPPVTALLEGMLCCARREHRATAVCTPPARAAAAAALPLRLTTSLLAGTNGPGVIVSGGSDPQKVCCCAESMTPQLLFLYKCLQLAPPP